MINKRKFDRLVSESILRNRIHERLRRQLIKEYKVMKKQGVHPQIINENLGQMIKGVFKPVVGFFGGDEATAALGLQGNAGEDSFFKTMLKQYGFEFVVEKMGFDPHHGMGLVLKNTLEESVDQLTAEELKDIILARGDCNQSALKLAGIALGTLSSSLKEMLLNSVMDAIIGETGESFRTSPLTKPMYIQMREKFSDSFANFAKDEKIKQDIADFICENLNVSSALGAGFDYAKGEFGNLIGDAGNTIKDMFK